MEQKQFLESLILDSTGCAAGLFLILLLSRPPTRVFVFGLVAVALLFEWSASGAGRALVGSSHFLSDLAANDGRQTEPYALRYARTRAGSVVYRHRGTGENSPATSGRPYCVLMSMLRKVTGADGTGRNAAFDHPVWGKTGTSEGYRDALFVGFSGHYVALAWVGRQSPGGIVPERGITGGDLPAKEFRRMMATLHGGRPVLPARCTED